MLRDLEFYWEDHKLLSPPLHRRVAVERANQRHLYETLALVQPDVVSVWNMGAMSLGLLTTVVGRGLPIVYCVCDDWLDYGPQLDAWTRLFLRRPRLAGLSRLLTGVPTVLPDLGGSGTFCFVSERTRRWAEQHSAWTFPDATVVYSGSERHDFPVLSRSEPERPWAWRLLYVGRIDERKGIDTAVRALSLLPEQATLEIIGRGDRAHLARLWQLAGDLGVAARMRVDAAEREALRDRYLAADVFVFPVTWDEPFGLAPVEAMACGTPVVATGAGGSAEFLADGCNCVIFEPGHADALARSVHRLAGDPVLRGRLREGGMTTAEELTVDRLAGVLEAWHVAAAERFTRGRPAHRRPPAAHPLDQGGKR